MADTVEVWALQDVIQAIETDLPGYDWLIRSNKVPLDEETARAALPPSYLAEYTKSFFANVIPPNRPHQSRGAYADSPEEALKLAYQRMFAAERGLVRV